MTLILDCDFGSRLDELGEEGIFWICDSLVNRQAAGFLKAKLSQVHILPPDAVTTCQKKSGQDLDTCFASIVHTISEHHNWTKINVYGMALDHFIIDYLCDRYPGISIAETTTGFHAGNQIKII